MSPRPVQIFGLRHGPGQGREALPRLLVESFSDVSCVCLRKGTLVLTNCHFPIVPVPPVADPAPAGRRANIPALGPPGKQPSPGPATALVNHREGSITRKEPGGVVSWRSLRCRGSSVVRGGGPPTSGPGLTSWSCFVSAHLHIPATPGKHHKPQKQESRLP